MGGVGGLSGTNSSSGWAYGGVRTRAACGGRGKGGVSDSGGTHLCTGRKEGWWEGGCVWWVGWEERGERMDRSIGLV